MAPETNGPALTCPGCGSPDVDLSRGLLCGTCATAVAEEAGEAGGETGQPNEPDGYFAEIAFMGRIEYTGYVTQITKHGQAAYHIDLPEKLWGGNPLAWVEHAASAWFSERPATEVSVRRQWEARVRAAAERARREAEWQQREQQLELTTGVRVTADGFDLDGAYEGDYGDDDD